MKLWVLLLAITGCSAAAEIVPSDSNYGTVGSTDMVKITPHPLKMETNVAILCVRTTYPTQPSIHSDKFFNIFATKSAVPIIKSGKGTYPVGTVILKQKYSDPEGKNTELFTGMAKREAGYNPRGGDWEYFVLSADGKTKMDDGALASCMGCHQAYKSSDYVTREYFTESFLYNPKPGN